MIVSKFFIGFCFLTLLLLAEPKASDEDRYVQRQIVNQNFIKAGLTDSELNEINEIVEKLGIDNLPSLEDAVNEYASTKLTKEKQEKVQKVIAELKEGMEFMKNAFGKLVGTFLKSFEEKQNQLSEGGGSGEDESDNLELEESEEDNEENEGESDHDEL